MQKTSEECMKMSVGVSKGRSKLKQGNDIKTNLKEVICKNVVRI
jgi:hypothetical protein